MAQGVLKITNSPGRIVSTPGKGDTPLRSMNLLNRITDVGFVVASIIGIVTLVGVIGAIWVLLVR